MRAERQDNVNTNVMKITAFKVDGFELNYDTVQ